MAKATTRSFDASTGIVTYSTHSDGSSISGGTNKTYTTEVVSLRAGETFKRIKIVSVQNSNIVMRGNAQTLFGAQGWDTWKTSSTGVWSDGSGVSVQLHNNSSSAIAITLYAVIEAKAIKVVAGDDILATDGQKVGLSATVGGDLSGSGWSAGTDATASSFNTKYNLQ